MKIKTVLFDLDGTLLCMDQDEFMKAYFSRLADKLKKYGYESEMLIKSIWKGTAAMVKNDGKESNEVVFWRAFAEIYGEGVLDDKYLFEDYYHNEFNEVELVKKDCSESVKTVEFVKSLGLVTALATNPVFPSIATRKRIHWAGLSEEDFALYTTYENIGYCKPNTEYYAEIARRLGVSCEECLMVGNDVGEDMVASNTGMKVFLVTDYIINKNNEDIDRYPHGSFADFRKYLTDICK